MFLLLFVAEEYLTWLCAKLCNLELMVWLAGSQQRVVSFVVLKYFENIYSAHKNFRPTIGTCWTRNGQWDGCRAFKWTAVSTLWIQLKSPWNTGLWLIQDVLRNVREEQAREHNNGTGTNLTPGWSGWSGGWSSFNLMSGRMFRLARSFDCDVFRNIDIIMQF